MEVGDFGSFFFWVLFYPSHANWKAKLTPKVRVLAHGRMNTCVPLAPLVCIMICKRDPQS